MKAVSVTTRRASAPQPDTAPEPSFPIGALLAAIITTFMLEAMRVFVSYMVFVVDQSQRTTLAVLALGVFLAIGLAGIPVRVLGPTAALRLAIAGLLLSRLALQFWEQPMVRLVLGAATIICWGWAMVTLLASRREATALGVVLGLGLDLAVRIAFGTVDLPWMPGVAAHAVTLLLAGLLVAALVRFGAAQPPAEPRLRHLAPLFAVGPGIVLFHLVTGNLGFAYVKTGLGVPWANVVFALGTILGIAGIAWLVRRPGSMTLSGTARGTVLTGSVVAGLLGLWLPWSGSVLAPLGLAVAVAVISALLGAALLTGGRPAKRRGIAGITFWFTGSMVLQVGLLFAYYTYSGRPSIVAITAVLFVLGVLAGGLPGPVSTRPGRVVLLPAVLAGLLLLVCAGKVLTWSAPEPVAPLGRDLTVMTYNIQSGFAIDDYWSLEATARTIEAEEPDVVVLQEVSRGWLVTTGVDEVLWLSQRLGMPYVFGANSDDGLWGNAILSRAPITGVSRYQYTSTQNLKRGLIAVQVATETGELLVLGTHLDNPIEAGTVRLQQVNELIERWGGRTPALLLGDLNAEPDSEALHTLAAAGFTDPSRALGPEAWTSADHRRIDYILVTSDVAVRDVRIPAARTSDHRPVVAEVHLGQ